MGGLKKHKKHKKDRQDASIDAKPPALKLILKVGSSSTTPEHSNTNSFDWQGPSGAQSTPQHLQNLSAMYTVHNDEESMQSINSSNYFMGPPNSHHKKSKKKKKKKDKTKERDRKHRHHHKEKKRKRDESSQDEISFNEDSLGVQEAVDSAAALSREPRLCVVRQRAERTCLQKLLEHLLKALEKRDVQNFFAWPVTDNIAPGYSHIISSPMDFSTMRQKIDDNFYPSLQEFIGDFRLMCTNALEYNHVDTIYYKAAKKLLHAGIKLMHPEKLGSWVVAHLPSLSSTELGFEIFQDIKPEIDMDTEDIIDSSSIIPPLSKFEAIPDDLTPDEILAQCQAAAKNAKAQLNMKYLEPKMGFLRQKKDGTTTLNILVGGDGVIPGTLNERPVSLGVLTGKIAEGSGSLQGFREDRRNVVKPVKPLYYGAFGTYAPSFDSTFANLSKEETDLVFATYGSDTAVQYAESILDFAKDCDYTLRLVDNLLDLLTGGEHTKTKKTLDEKKKLKDEEDTIKVLLEENEANKVDIDHLKTLSDVGIDVSFLQTFESQMKNDQESTEFQQKLQSTSQLLEKLQQVQNERLSLPLPAHLSNLPNATEQELSLAESITSNLTEMSKKVTPADIVSVNSLRKAMGINLPHENAELIDVLHANTCLTNLETQTTEMPDLESELRQFLESEPGLVHSPLRDDKTIEEILME